MLQPVWLRIVTQLPLILVLLTFLWAQYTISISLVLSYLLKTRNLLTLSLSIAIPFNLFWFASITNLCRCILTGPGWVQRTTPQTHQSNNTIPNHRHQECPNDDQDEDDDQNTDQASIPLLSAPQNDHPLSSLENHSVPFSHSPSGQLSPRPALTSTSPPPYLARRSINSSPNLSFQEQVQRQQTSRSPRSATTDILHALNFPPSSTPLPPRNPNQQIETLMCKSDGSLRFCRKCNHYKADRSHHCSSCGKCVLRMDHHCPWLGGRCVGLNNHKFFILFLLYTTLTCITSTFSAANGLMEFLNDPIASSSLTNNNHYNSHNNNNFQLAPLNWAFLVLVGALFGLVLAGFTSYHFYLIAVNRTTIENMERSVRIRPISTNERTESYALLRTTRLKGGVTTEVMNDEGAMEEGNVNGISGENGSASSMLPSYDTPIYKSDYQLTRAERKKLEHGSTKLNLFDRGSTLANFREVFGTQAPLWHWPLPIAPIGISDGYTYPINQENLDELLKLTSQIRLLPNHRSAELRFERP